MSKHTSGPWLVAPDGNVVSGQAGIIERIAVSIFCSKERRDANARLIAAAPQMLEALERLSSAATAVNQQRHDNPDPMPMFVALGEMLSAIKQADEAIKAAKGEV